MNIGIVGSGNMGRGIGLALAKAGHQVFFSFSKDISKLKALAESAPGGQFGRPAEAAAFADVLILSVWFGQLDDALAAAGDLGGKTVITCVSGLKPDFQGLTMGMPADLSESVAETLARRLPDSHVVEAFNLTFAETIGAPDRIFGAVRPSLPYCGNDPKAKETCAALIADCGYEPIDAGDLAAARSLETLASVWVQTAVVTKLFPNCALAILRR